MSIINNFSMDYFSLTGRTAMVTGASKGIGQGIALALAKAGADIFAVVHHEDFNDTKKLIEEEGVRADYYVCNLGDKKEINNAIDKCVKTFGRLDILINNAGMIKRAPILEYKDEDFENVLELNLSSVFYLSREAGKIMERQGGGKIINIASMLSFQGGKYVPAYTASKHGVVGLTKSFANELSEKNIQVNAIAPGYIITNNTEALINDKKRYEEITSRIPAGRWGTPYDLMGAAVFLSSRASDYITGHTLAVDGGWLVR